MLRALALAALATAATTAGASADSMSGMSTGAMTVDAAHKSVSFVIKMAENGNNGTLNFNGYGHGAMTLVVPMGWDVKMHVINEGAGAIPHSLEVLPVTESIPNQGSDPPAFAGAETVNLVEGMKVKQADDLDFTADTVGKYWIFCGVPNHGVGGMWDYLKISSSATAPAIQIDTAK